VKPPFQLREAPTAEIIALLAETTLGTSGARYQHLDVLERIHTADQPLYLSVERAQKVLGNITFCRRGNKWYIRYFAFRSPLQSSGKLTHRKKNEGLARSWVTQFFEDTLEGKFEDQKVDLFYAYIDPKNERSKRMSENFGFHVAGNLVTQSFSRVYPKASSRIQKLVHWEEVSSDIQHRFSKYQHYDEAHLKTPPFYVLLNAKGEQIACAHTTKVRWKIERLPGKFGGILTKVVPYIPFLRALIKPNDHQFLVPDCVWTKDNDSRLLEELFSAILFEEKLNLMLWWTDINDPLYLGVKNEINWGLLHKIIGVSPVDIVVREKNPTESEQPFFVCAWDMV
jgi:hypothetical protein